MPCEQFCPVKCHLCLPRQQIMKIPNPIGIEGVNDRIMTLQGGNHKKQNLQGVTQNPSTLQGVKAC
jgi:hypothetical protein